MEVFNWEGGMPAPAKNNVLVQARKRMRKKMSKE
jgi:predicted Fe-S protein YdhL (DUF1289 family)